MPSSDKDIVPVRRRHFVFSFPLLYFLHAQILHVVLDRQQLHFQALHCLFAYIALHCQFKTILLHTRKILRNDCLYFLIPACQQLAAAPVDFQTGIAAGKCRFHSLKIMLAREPAV